jgi:dihydrofolate reductase
MPRKIVVAEYISLDGVIEDPVGMENSGLGDWTGPFNRGPEGDKFKHDELLAIDAILLGHVTYDAFAAVWPSVKDDTGFADRINSLPKFVASNTLEQSEWNNTTILSDNAIEQIRDLKKQAGGDILVYGSTALVHALMPHGLIDEYNLMVYPTVLGRGKRLFPNGYESTLTLVECKPLGSGIVLLRYRSESKSQGVTNKVLSTSRDKLMLAWGVCGKIALRPGPDPSSGWAARSCGVEFRRRERYAATLGAIEARA